MSNGIKAMVTGSSGFIGSHVVRTLKARGLDVYGYDRQTGDDILAQDRLYSIARRFQPNWIIHLAAQAYLKPSQVNPQDDAITNIIGTLNILEAARRNNSGIIFSSSGAVYGNNYQYPQPISPYGVSKLTAERYCQLYNKFYNVNTVVFRFSSVYGQGRKKVSIVQMITKALNNEAIQVTGNGLQTRDFTHVSDIVEAIHMGITNQFPSGIYDIGTGIATSINELIVLISKLLKKEVKVEYVPAVVGDPERNELNVSKAASYGFKTKVSLTKGIQKLIEELK